MSPQRAGPLSDRIRTAHRRALQLVDAIDAVWLKRTVATHPAAAHIAIGPPPQTCPDCEDEVQPVVRRGAATLRCPQCGTRLEPPALDTP